LHPPIRKDCARFDSGGQKNLQGNLSRDRTRATDKGPKDGSRTRGEKARKAVAMGNTRTRKASPEIRRESAGEKIGQNRRTMGKKIWNFLQEKKR